MVEHHPSVFCRDGERLLNLATGENWSLARPQGCPSQLHPLDIAGRLVAEDFCLLMPDTAHPTQGYRLVGASLCSPSAWRLADKIARPLAAIHQPVPGYVEKLARPVDRLFAQLKPDRLMGRFNWIVTDSPAAFRPFRPPIATPGQGWDAGAELWLRVERQTIQRLPMTGAILFTIRTHITRLDAAIRTADSASELAAAIREMPAATQRYRDIAPVVPALLDWLDCRAVEYAKLASLPLSGGGRSSAHGRAPAVVQAEARAKVGCGCLAWKCGITCSPKRRRVLSTSSCCAGPIAHSKITSSIPRAS